MKIARPALSLITLILCVYMLISKNFEIMPIVQFLIAILITLMGITVYRKNNKPMGVIAFLVAAFIVVANIYVIAFL